MSGIYPLPALRSSGFSSLKQLGQALAQNRTLNATTNDWGSQRRVFTPAVAQTRVEMERNKVELCVIPLARGVTESARTSAG